MKKILGNEKGAVAIIIAVGLVALMLAVAMTIDVGSLFEERRLLQTVADSAALAGAQELPENPDEAIQKAVDYANNNYGENVDSIDVEISSTLATNDTITVTVLNPDAPLYFARVTGKDSTPVVAGATATVGSPAALGGGVPWGVPEENWVPGEEYVLKWGSGKDAESPPSNSQALELDYPGGNEYRWNIVDGCDEILIPGVSEVPTKTGSGLVGPTEKGTLERIGGYAGLDSFESLTTWSPEKGYELSVPDDKQFVWVIIIPELDFSGKKDLLVLGFAPFIITDIQTMEDDPEFGNGIAIVGTFLNTALIISEGPIAPVETEGLRVIRLIK